jgi:hypothetical protein
MTTIARTPISAIPRANGGIRFQSALTGPS